MSSLGKNGANMREFVIRANQIFCFGRRGQGGQFPANFIETFTVLFFVDKKSFQEKYLVLSNFHEETPLVSYISVRRNTYYIHW